MRYALITLTFLFLSLFFSTGSVLAQYIPGGEEETLPSSTQAAELFAALPEDIKTEILEEVQTTYNDCARNEEYSIFHDCECISVKFLDARVLAGPEVPHNRIYQNIMQECVNDAGVAGFSYDSCASVMKYDRLDDLDKYCSCYANEVAKIYAKNPNTSTAYINDIGVKSYLKCNKEIPLLRSRTRSSPLSPY